MATYTIQSEGNHIVPYTLQVTSPISITMAYSNKVGSMHEYDSPEFNAQMQLCVDNIENYYKTLPEFSVQDESRNATWQCVNPVEDGGTPGQINYDLNVGLVITNATLQLTVNSQTDLTGEGKDTFLQTEADNAVLSFKANRNWMDI